MTPKEATSFLTTMQFMYIDSFRGINQKAIEVMAKIWSDEFKDNSLNECIAALRRHANSSEFCPKIKNIRDELIYLMEKGTNTAAEAWDKCFKLAIDLPLYDQVSYNLDDYGLDEIELKTLRAIGVRNIKMSEKIAVERSNFITLYNELKNKADKEYKMPNNLKSLKYKQDLLLLERRKNERLLLEEKNKKEITNNLLLKASEEVEKCNISTDEKILFLQKFKQKLKSGI